MKNLYLLCNAHIDPAWLWRRDEGEAAAISTFRTAADFCEEYEGFVFNHNEALLYEWVEQEEPELFARIQRLVKEGKWNIIGGTYLQPDCNMPNGESVIRQIRYGQRYFREKFGVETDKAFHMDAFGHSRGLVQIYKKMGYHYYIFMRPNRLREMSDFVWEGVDGSRLIGHQLWRSYSTRLGETAGSAEECILENGDSENFLMFWGVGDHGGGPSRIDLEQLAVLQEKYPEVKLIHSDGRAYFDSLDPDKLPIVRESRRPSMIGCYTSVCRIKQEHRHLENMRAVAEKMLAHARLSVEQKEWDSAQKAILFNEFHDILPGTLIKSAERDALWELHYAGVIFERYITDAFFKLAAGQRKAKDGEIPILVYNPHPYPVETDVEAEFQLGNQNHNEGEYTIALVYDQTGKYVPVQHEKPECSVALDWRKKITFHTILEPMSMNRFDCVLEVKKDYQMIAPFEETEETIVVCSSRSRMCISKQTGLIDSFIVDGRERLKAGSGRLRVYKDNEDPWGMTVKSFEEYEGEFVLADALAAREFGGCSPIEVIENGEVRICIQVIFQYKYSFAVVTYIISKFDIMPRVHIEIFSNNRCVMLKYCVTPVLEDGRLYGQTAFGTEQLPMDNLETCFQQWCGLQNAEEGFYILNKGSYGGSTDGRELRISLLRTACYAAHPVYDRPIVTPGRFNEPIDMGLREFDFQFMCEKRGLDRQAQLFNEGLRVLSFFPSGEGEVPKSLFQVEESQILLTFVSGNDKEGYWLRLYNADEKECQATIVHQGQIYKIFFGGFEVKRLHIKDGHLTEKDRLEE